MPLFTPLRRISLFGIAASILILISLFLPYVTIQTSTQTHYSIWNVIYYLSTRTRSASEVITIAIFFLTFLIPLLLFCMSFFGKSKSQFAVVALIFNMTGIAILSYYTIAGMAIINSPNWVNVGCILVVTGFLISIFICIQLFVHLQAQEARGSNVQEQKTL